MHLTDIPFVRNAFNYNTDHVSRETGLLCLEPSMAHQEFKEECDINVLAHRFGLTGVMPMNPNTPSYGDFGEVLDFQSAMNAIVNAKADFMSLTPQVRKRFNNDPQELLLFMEDPSNRKEAVSLGLISPPPTHTTTQAQNGATAPQNAPSP